MCRPRHTQPASVGLLDRGAWAHFAAASSFGHGACERPGEGKRLRPAPRLSGPLKFFALLGYKYFMTISRAEAQLMGLRRFYTGIACARGHITERHVSSNDCVLCKAGRRRSARRETESRVRGLLRWNVRRRAVRAAMAAARPRRVLRTQAERRAAEKAWRQANPGRYRELKRRWRVNNREQRRAEHRARKIRRRAAVIAHLMQKQAGRCVYCPTLLSAKTCHIDHRMPRALGGTNDLFNLQLTCIPCNLRKHAKHPDVFAQMVVNPVVCNT